MSRVGSSRNEDVLVLGMNAHPETEAEAIQRSNPGARVTTLRDTARDDEVVTAGPWGPRVHDLKGKAGIDSFVATLGLPREQGQRVAAAITGAGPDARDELAQLAQVWARAEKGGVVPSRLVLSGHSEGMNLWGGDDWGFKNGVLSRDTLGQLAAAMPRAAAQVEDLCVAACNNGGKTSVEQWRAVFPQVRTVWAYAGSAPGSASGATDHLSRWEKATRGEVNTLPADAAQGLRKGENLAVWSPRDGYQSASAGASVEELRTRHASGRANFARYFDGAEEVRDSQHGPLRAHYNTLQSLLGRTEVSASERPGLERERDQTLRVLFYGNVASHFQQVHQERLQRGFAALGWNAPDFSRMGRGEALSVIRSFETELSRRQSPPWEARRLLPLLTEGLRELRPERVPENWL